MAIAESDSQAAGPAEPAGLFVSYEGAASDVTASSIYNVPYIQSVLRKAQNMVGANSRNSGF